MADNTEPRAKFNDPFPTVTDEEYDGRSFQGPDNKENVQHYVGVDPVYQNYANEGEKPFPFSEEELVAAAEKGGLEADEVFMDDDEDEDQGGEPDEPEKDSMRAPEPVKPAATAPSPRSAPSTRAAAKDSKSSDDKK